MLPVVRYASRLATGRCCVQIIHLTVKLTEQTRNANPIYRNVCPHGIIQGVFRLEDITAGGDFIGLCDKKNSYKHVSDFGRLRSYGHF